MMSVYNLSFWIFIAEQGGIYFYNNKPTAMVRCVSDRYFPTIKFDISKARVSGVSMCWELKSWLAYANGTNKSILLYEQYRKY